MRTLTMIFATFLLALLLPLHANAQAGFFSSAQVLEKQSARVGAEFLAGSVGFMGHVRYGAGEQFDLGVRTGILHDNKVNRFQIGFDGRYPFMSERDGDQADIDFAGLFHISTGQSVTSWSVGVGPQLGKTFPMSNSDVTIAPYAGILLGANHTGSSGGIEEIGGIQVEVPKGSSTDFGVLIPLGGDVRINDLLGIFGEVDITIDGGTDATVALGINYFVR